MQRGLVEDQAHFLLYCPCLNIIRSNLFVYCNQINSKFISMSPFNKLHFLLNTNNKESPTFYLRCMNSDNPCYSPFNHPPLTSVTILAGQFSDCHSNNHYYYYYYYTKIVMNIYLLLSLLLVNNMPEHIYEYDYRNMMPQDQSCTISLKGQKFHPRSPKHI